MSASPFDSIEAAMRRGGAEAALQCLVGQLREEKQYQQLFDARLMQARQRLGLTVSPPPDLEQLPEPLRARTEEAYLDACREIGGLLAAEGRFRHAWLFLRTAGERQPMIEALQSAEATDENRDELIEVALHEGVAPRLGLKTVLQSYGICNAITTFESIVRHQPMVEQQACAALLIRHLYEQLMTNVRAHIEQQERKPPEETSLGALLTRREELLAGGGYHVDTSHLASVVRISRLVEDEPSLRLALDLTEYGRRLSEVFQFPGEPPFVEVYPSHALWLSAQLGQRVEEALLYFGQQARSSPIDDQGSGPVEAYLILLCRLDRWAEALEAWDELVPPEVALSGYVPSLLDLARRADHFERYLQICRQRQDRLGFLSGLIELPTGNRSAESGPA